jgi:Right handed beta helix region
MALTDRYVTTTGSGTYAGSTSSSTPMSLATAFTSAVAGDRINIQSGTYTLSASYTLAAGTATNPIVFRGYNSTLGDLDTISRTSGNGALVTTNHPVLDWSATSGVRLNGGVFNICQNLDARVNFDGNGFILSNDSAIYNCKVSNSAGSASTSVALYLGQRAIAYGCDVNNSGTSPRSAIGTTDSQGFIAIGCRATCNGGSGFYASTTTGTGVIAFCTIYGCKLHGIQIAAGPWCIFNNTITKPSGAATGDGINIAANTFRNAIVNNHITDMAAYGINTVTTANATFVAYNRTRGNTSGAVNLSGTTNWLLASILNHVTSGSGTSSDYVDYTNNDFNLISTAPGKAAGQPLYLDLGALQRQETGGGGFVIGS